MKKFLFTYSPAIASGILLSCCFPRFHFHWLTWMALVPLFYKTAKDAPKITAFHFYLCAHIFHTLLLQWLIANLFWAGGWAIIGQQLLCVALSLFWAVLGWGWGMARSRNSRYAGAWCMAGLWCLMELLQARMFTGFGWSALGYAQGGNLWVAQWAAVGGVTLISFLLVGVNALLALGLREAESRFVRLLAAVVVVGMAHGAGVLLLKEADYATRPLNAGIVQPNFSQEMKWDGAYDVDMLQRTAQLTRALSSRYNPDITVWPEALIVRHFESPEVMEVLSSLTQETQSYLFTGAVRNDYATSKSFNSSALMGPDGKLRGYYDKVRLAAFGEYIPFEHYLPFLGQIAFGGVDAGQEQRVLSVKDRNLGPLICFEVLFAPMAEALRAKGADMLAVVTNLAWFGGANAIPQELEIARMRAIETRLPLLHSANTGISGIFDPYGRFHVVRQTVSFRGELTDWGPKVQPHHVIMRRFVGAFPVAAPATRPLPYGPVAAPWAVAFLGVILFLLAMTQRFRVRVSQTLSPLTAAVQPMECNKSAEGAASREIPKSSKTKPKTSKKSTAPKRKKNTDSDG